MLKIKHRINSTSDLILVDSAYGVEVDLRANSSEIYLSHEPFTPGELLRDFLLQYTHKFIILNVKEDGLEDKVVEILSTFGIKDYFFLDQPFPSLRKNNLIGRNCAIRVSEYEEIPSLVPVSEWVWIDSFTGNWEHLQATLEFAADNKIRTCLVSPELQSRRNLSEINQIKERLEKLNLNVDAVCTKNPEVW